MNQPELRPTVVSAAYWLWFAAAVVLILMGLGWLFVDEATILAADPNFQNPGQLVDLMRMYGGIALVSAVFVAFLAGRMRRGDARYRRSLVAFSVVLSIFQIMSIWLVGAGFFAIAVVAPVVAASILVYRPAAKSWFS
ncbi:hypothetical protein IEU95_16195 [Hoyosella rhizosphaerae]|uniref:Uncharacterized protein n=1 Tax=Hoyosella rhizosphaerae TaxID=1755582 RepID=A0A916UJD6_9ACTN|nr:hypothetical protein [Hoyosella rhizosphaerae]MBN4928375.1 hypothetical protein [Hoyosella rhizosphaerae]GGC74458.1 hypothetical protein GCM10011410_29700 [Hoyosella rhizosphaerae]